MDLEDNKGDERTVPEAVVRRAVAKITSSREFLGAEQAQELLRYLVNQTLSGNDSQLSDKLITVDFFNRRLTESSATRMSVSRLRERLDRYYQSAGRDDELFIELLKGDYVPKFRWRVPVQEAPETSQYEPEWRISSPVGEPRPLDDVPGHQTLRLGAGRHRRRLLLGAGITFVVVLCFELIFGRVVNPSPQSIVRTGRLFVRSTSEGRKPIRMPLGQTPVALIVTRDSQKLFVIESHGTAVRVLRVSDLHTLTTLRLPAPAYSAAMDRAGLIYVGTAVGVAMIDSQTDRVEGRLFSTESPVWDITVTPDGKKLFLAMGSAGLKRITTATGAQELLSRQPRPMFAQLDPLGRWLYVSYQSGGPGGRSGHDAIEVYDARRETRLDRLNNLARVGGQVAFSPVGDLVMMDGWDGCAWPAYDHIGCPKVPSHVVDLIATGDRKLLRTLALPTDTGSVGAFLPDGERFFLGGYAPSVIDVVKSKTLERLAPSADLFPRAAVTPDGQRAFISHHSEEYLMAFDAEPADCPPSRVALLNFYSGDGTVDDSNTEASLVANGPVRYAPGVVGQAFRFDGNTFFSVDSAGACYPCGNHWTISLYIRVDLHEQEMTIFDRPQQGGHDGYRLITSRQNRLVLCIQGETSREFETIGEPALVSHRWYQVAVTSDENGISLYLNGQLIKRQYGFEPRHAKDLSWGPLFLAGTSQGKSLFTGLIDEVALHARSLSGDEIRAAYEQRTSGRCKP